MTHSFQSIQFYKYKRFGQTAIYHYFDDEGETSISVCSSVPAKRLSPTIQCRNIQKEKVCIIVVRSGTKSSCGDPVSCYLLLGVVMKKGSNGFVFKWHWFGCDNSLIPFGPPLNSLNLTNQLPETMVTLKLTNKTIPFQLQCIFELSTNVCNYQFAFCNSNCTCTWVDLPTRPPIHGVHSPRPPLQW